MKKTRFLILGIAIFLVCGMLFNACNKKEEPNTPVPGLYDANDNLVASWDELVNTYGMDLEKDYSSFEVSNDIHCLKNILSNKRALHPGSKFIIAEINEIGDLAFCRSERLTSIIIPDSVTAIGYGSFNGCTGLTSIDIPDSVTSIGNSAFGVCTSLTSITIPSSVTSIGDSTFAGCTGLTSVTIPSSITSIGYCAFWGCTSLTNITFDGTVEEWNAVTFGDEWNLEVPATEVVCSDGTVTLPTY